MDERRINVLYASETGTTEDRAQELGRTLERLRFTVDIVEMDSFEPKKLLSTSLAIFMCPTTGQGDVPENMSKFWRFLLRKKLPPTLLQHMRFSTFGLGDSTYPKFNWAVKKLHKRLLQLGAVEFYIRGEGDDQHEEGVDGTLIPWVEGLSSKLLDLFPLPDGISPIPSYQLLPPKYTLSIDSSKPTYGDQSYASNISLPRGPSSFKLTVSRNTRLTPETHFQDTRLLSFTSDIPLTHSPGDAISILATNPPEVVEEAIEILNLPISPDQPLTLTSSQNLSQVPIIAPLTLRTLLTHHLDITAIPRRSFFTFCASFTNDETHKERLLDFTNPLYSEELFDYTTRPRRSILEVLQEFGSVKVPLEYLVEMIPKIKARLFSIASSSGQFEEPMLLSSTPSLIPATDGKNPSVEGGRLDLLIAIVKYRTVIKRIRRGMCTRYISTLRPGDTLNVTITKGGLGGSSNSARTTTAIAKHHFTPVVMIGPGTGVAPMRALAYERLKEVNSYLNNTDTTTGGLKPAKTLLFFGCRGVATDYYFGEEWEQLVNMFGTEVFDVKTAFSRDQERKRYVQHLIKEEKEEVWRLVGLLGGVVYVCGSSGRMPQAVREALIEVFTEVGGKSRDDAEAYLLGMEGEGRYRQETW
ncbi:NAPDH-dependent diflavin reductase [Orbilia blumenaviensis]|uniref:NADPH-dependent diflavin oxidoreductase 1 n=1 Tax=Orbilia blumenaviensis TaxID=1796055 RepID=A0AAV9U8K3_9PEZI